MTKAKRIAQLQEWRQEDFTECDSWRKRALKSYRFYTGYRQWKEADIAKLDAEGRPHLQVPLVFPIINTLMGHQIANKQDIKLFPRRGGSVAVAALGTELIKHTMDICDGEHHLGEVFLDGIVGAVGAIEIEHQYRYDKITGELVVKKRSPFAVLFDQNASEYDFNESGRRVNIEKWMTGDEIKSIFGKGVTDLQEAHEAPRFHEDTIQMTDDYSESADIQRERRDQYLVRKCYWRKWRKQSYLIDLENLNTRPLNSPKVIEFAKSAIEVHKRQATEMRIEPKMKIIERAGWFLYLTYYAGEMELYHKEDPWNGIMDFPVIPYYPYWADGYPISVLDNLKDCQEELNKRVSQELHILNTTANAGWRIGSGANAEALRDLKEQGSKSGFVIDESKFGGKAEKIEPNTLPVGQHVMADQHEKYMDRISGVDPNLRGITERKESGKALNIRASASLTVSQVIYENFNRTQKTVAKFLWEAITQKDSAGESLYYSQKEIESIVQEASLKEFIKTDQGGQQIIDLSPFYDDAIGNYGIKISTSPNTPTMRMENLELLLRVAETYARIYGMPIIPPEYLIELTDIARKDELVEHIKRQQPMQPQQQAQGVA